MKKDLAFGYGDVVRKKKNGVPGCSDTVMQTLWRDVVRKEWGNRCAFYNDDAHTWYECNGSLECHHIIKRRRPHLRYVPTNGVLLCQLHHNMVEMYRMWRDRLETHVGDYKMEWLEAEERKLLPEFLAEHGWTRREWLKHQKAYLQKLLEAEE